MGSVSLKVEYLGSCRIATPLRKLQARGLIDLQTTRNYGFVHSPPEALQQLLFMRGAPFSDTSLKPIFAPNVDLEKMGQQPETKADLTVLELSSAKTFSIGKVVVQANYLTSYFETQLSKTQFRAFRQALSRNDMPAFLQKFGSKLDAQQREWLSSLARNDGDQKAVTDYLNQIRSLCTELVVVPHVDAIPLSGRPLASRRLFRENVLNAAQDLNLPVFDPTDLLYEVGQSLAISDSSEGLAHYTDAFADYWAAAFANAHLLANVSLPKLGADDKKRRVTRAAAEKVLALPSPNSAALISLLEKGDHLPAKMLASAARALPERPLPLSWSSELTSSVLEHFSLNDILERLDAGEKLHIPGESLLQLWSTFTAEEPTPYHRFATLGRLARQIRLSDRIIGTETRNLRRIAKDTIRVGDLDLARWLSRLAIDGLTLPPEVHLYCARLAYFKEDWPLCIEQGMIALRALPENRGGWIRLGRAASALGLSEIEQLVQSNLSRLGPASP